VTWLLPELEEGALPELKPFELELELFELELELLELLEFELPELDEVPELEELELELEVPELDELEFELDDPELELDEPELVEFAEVLEACVEPGRARASAPAVTTLAMLTTVVAERTLSRPRSRAAMARRMPSRCSLLMGSILRSGLRSLLRGTSRFPMRRTAPVRTTCRLPRQHEGELKVLVLACSR
jgi:hypothetical protein